MSWVLIPIFGILVFVLQAYLNWRGLPPRGEVVCRVCNNWHYINEKCKRCES